jgi:hypothetical protein
MYVLKHKWTMCKRCAGRIRKVVGRKLCNSCHKELYGYLPDTIISGLVKKGGLFSGGGRESGFQERTSVKTFGAGVTL